MFNPTKAIDKTNCVVQTEKLIKHNVTINDSMTEFMALTSSFVKHQFNDLQINVGNSQIDPSITTRI